VTCGLLAGMSLAQAGGTGGRGVRGAANVGANEVSAATTSPRISGNATTALSVLAKPPENVVQIISQPPFFGTASAFERVPGRYFLRRCIISDEQENLSVKSATCDESRTLPDVHKLRR